MDMGVGSLHAGGIRRIRQACANCRRKKTKCTGERPICFHCRRNRLACVYEPYSATVSDGTRPASLSSLAGNLNNVELLQRISTIESRLAELSGRSNRNDNDVSNFSFEPSSPPLDTTPLDTTPLDTTPPQSFSSIQHAAIDISTFPPPAVLASVIDTYFEHVHNQPYSYFQEVSFRQKLESNALPRCLVLAVLSSAVRFSVHEYYGGRTREASEMYARESWLSVLTDHLTVEGNLNVHVVQSVNLLAVVDYTAGRVSQGWLKIGLAARISQDLRLMTEPEAWLPYPEQEERRRAFWSAYLIDKLISCGKSRPLVILDQDCNVQLPCDEETFNRGEWKKTNTLEQLLNWNTEIVDNPSGFGLVILMASIFGRCTRYVHQNRKADEILPPWDTKSEFAGINSSLLLLESYSKLSTQSLPEVIQQSHLGNTNIDRQQIGHLIFAHTLYHLCHCLLNHPFLLRIRLKPFGSKAPPSFSARALQVGCDHAKQLMDLLHDATENGCRIESSFYAYCIAVAGGIHSLASHLEHQTTARRQSDIMHYFNESVESLERLAKLWVHASNMAVRLREFHSISDRFASLLDPKCLEDLDPASEEVCWSMIDYAILGADPSKKPLIAKTGFSNLPSPSQWALGSEPLTGDTPQFDGASTDIFSGLAPNMRLNDVDYLLNCSPGTNNIV